ncbi:glycosyltransferase family 2 protein [bacterium]|nr:glycosyltransferase family 2 protein [bacterium]
MKKVMVGLVFSLFGCFFSFDTQAKDQKAIDQKPIVVVIASFKNADWYKKNLDSIFNQNYSNYRIVYVDDCSPDGTGDLVEQYVTEKDQWHRFTLVKNKVRKLKMANTYMAYHEHCKDHEIVAELDGDDWVSHDNVLANINKIYSESDVWMTYGHFMEWPTNIPQIMRSIPKSAIENQTVKKLPGCMWAGLRTYYAWLVKKVKLEDLLYKGKFLPYTSDAAIMFPMFEMSGYRFGFVTDDMWLQHNVKTPLNDHKVDPSNIAYKICQIARNKPTYKRYNVSQCGFIEKLDNAKADVLVFAGNDEQKTQNVLDSLRHHVCNIGAIYIVQKDQLHDSNVVANCLYNDNKHILLLDDSCCFIQDTNITECIKSLEETQAFGFFFSRGKNCSNSLPTYVDGVRGSCAWQFAYGSENWAKTHSAEAVLYRKSDIKYWLNSIRLEQDMNKQPASNFYKEKVGLFFENVIATS